MSRLKPWRRRRCSPGPGACRPAWPVAASWTSRSTFRPPDRLTLTRCQGVHPSELVEATKALLDWAAGRGLTWDMSPDAAGERWGSRLEIYLTDPREEPDMSKWVTQLAFRLAD